MFRRHALPLICALLMATGTVAQPAPPPPPPPQAPPYSTAPLPPPMPDVGADPELEPQVTIIRRETETLEEVRVNGELRFIRVTPRVGPTYYLVPGSGGTFIRRDSLDFGLKPPMWLLFSW